ncbi:hypothetical protein GCM10010218_04030 [Streptomyces mashuensis]|uniref:AMP-dependent synthetase/ligase domain-containing protein n=1 Tax=Streptomyces mashuensis TaxID=33904 RepID=A0A919AV59_9ACTN|nr:AMP-binding protein [Streptomyces mashuensis]GHF26393.1 hypothetical protein GCM10010218_04030 [Streptomyces mashuensis]
MRPASVSAGPARPAAGYGRTAVALPPTTVIGPVEARAARTPGATALVAGAATLTYAGLNTRANRLARHLAGFGLGPGTCAALALPPGPRLVVALLAVLKTGAAYVPTGLAPDTAPLCVVTDAATRAFLPAAGGPYVVVDDPRVRARTAAQLPTDPGRALTPHHPVAVLGGTPVPHAWADVQLRALQGCHGLTAADRVLYAAPAGDPWPADLLWALREGATVVLAAPGTDRDPAALARTARRYAATTVRLAPEALVPFAEGTGGPGALRRVLCTGEELDRAAADRFHRALPGVGLHRHHRPAGLLGDLTHHHCAPGGQGPVPLGRPLWNARLSVRDEVLYLAGPWPAMDGPVTGSYRTGTRAVWDETGTLWPAAAP